jgi:putative membrane protein
VSWLFSGWHCDAAVVASCAIALVAYLLAARRYLRVRGRRWSLGRTAWFAAGIVTALVAIESPLDGSGEVRFAPHMIQHLVLADLTAPLLLLGAPLLLLLAATPTTFAKRVVGFLRSPAGSAIAFPPLTWSAFILALWLVHFTGFYEAALGDERIHIFEHAVFLGTALLFWFPIIAIGPAPWSQGALAYPLRMFYLLIAMPAEGMLGFAINGARHLLYPRYALAGMADQRAAGEIMWIGGTLAMFVAFMLVGLEWAKHEERLGVRADRRNA